MDLTFRHDILPFWKAILVWDAKKSMFILTFNNLAVI